MTTQDTMGDALHAVAELARDRALSGTQRRAALQRAVAALPGGCPRAEYPRPQLVRAGQSQWQSLNGVWTLCFDGYRQARERRWQDGDLPYPQPIVVPFAFQWSASGQGKRAIEEHLWYQRDLQLPTDWQDAVRGGDFDVLLHFEAVDYRCTAYINGEAIGHHQGGHTPFCFDITPFLEDGKNRLHLEVEDLQDPRQPRGKQSVNGVSHGCDYTNTSGIWGSVWLELAPSERIESLRLTPQPGENPGDDTLEVEALLHAAAGGWRVRVEAFEGLLPQTTGENGEVPASVALVEVAAPLAVARLCLPIPNAKRWSPDAPHLYGLRVQLLDENSNVRDEVISYAGMRSVALRDGKFLLNSEPLYLKMILDQGYWPQSGMTAPSEEAHVFDVEWTKACGFNAARKHQKVEDRRYLYHCDRLGLLVWGEMANARAWSAQSEEWFLAEWEAVVRRDFNAPCIVTWVPLNETWGLPSLKEEEHPVEYAFVEKVVALTRRLDATRPVVDNDGWQHTDVADIVTIHDYTKTAKELKKRWKAAIAGGPLIERLGKDGYRIFARGAKYCGQPIMFTEIGGFFTLPPGVSKEATPEKWDSIYDAYDVLKGADDLEARYRDLMEGIAALQFCCGFCYTQLSDIEQEVNGLLSFDRQLKIAPDVIAAIHREVFGR